MISSLFGKNYSNIINNLLNKQQKIRQHQMKPFLRKAFWNEKLH